MWICPTFQRPERLKELADSWEKHAPGKKLLVRIWAHDPKVTEYHSIEWPDSWNLYMSYAKGAGEALNEAFGMNHDPNKGGSAC